MYYFCYLFVTLSNIVVYSRTQTIYSMAKRVLKAKEPVRLRTKKLANGNHSLYLDIYQNGQRSYEFLKMYLIPEKSPLDKELNETVLRQANHLKAQKIISLNNSKAGFKEEPQEGKIGLVKWFEKIIGEDGTNQFLRNSSNNRSTLSFLKKFNKDIALKDIEPNYCRDLINYAQYGFKTSKGKTLSTNTAKNYITCVVAALNVAVRKGYIIRNPFSQLNSVEQIRKETSKRLYLSIEEVNKLKNTPCQKETVKKAFLFSCYSGLRISDVKSLKWDDIKEENGETFLYFVQRKTNNPLRIKITETQLQYTDGRGDAKDLVFPTLPSEATITRVLDKWAKSAGITKHVTFHIARHTFATMLLTKNADLYTVSKLMGHSDVKVTQIYAKIVDKKKDEAMSLLDD